MVPGFLWKLLLRYCAIDFQIHFSSVTGQTHHVTLTKMAVSGRKQTAILAVKV